MDRRADLSSTRPCCGLALALGCGIGLQRVCRCPAWRGGFWGIRIRPEPWCRRGCPRCSRGADPPSYASDMETKRRQPGGDAEVLRISLGPRRCGVGQETRRVRALSTTARWRSGDLARRARGSATLVSPSTWLIGYPRFNSMGVDIQCKFQPTFAYGQNITVQSSITGACGTWTIYRLEYDLACQTPNGPWFCQVLAAQEGQWWCRAKLVVPDTHLPRNGRKREPGSDRVRPGE